MTQENKPFQSASEPKRTKSAREMEADIAETRNALTDDIKALSDKVSPAHLKHEAKQALNDAKGAAVDKVVEVKDAALDLKDAAVDKAVELKDVALDKAVELKDVALDKAQEAADAVSETVEEVSIQARRAGQAAWGFAVDNAVPLALIGVGAGWLFSNRRRGRSLSSSDAAAAEYPADNTTFYSVEPYQRLSTRGDGSLGSTTDGGRKNGSGLSQAGSRVGKRTKAVYEKASEKLGSAEQALAQRASRGRELVTQKVSRAGQASREFAQDNPLAVAVGSLIAGVGVGLLLPSTAREDRLLGPSRERVRRMLGDASDAVRDVSSMARETAKDAVSSAEGRSR